MGKVHCLVGADIRIQNAPKEIYSYCKTNLTLSNPDYQKKVRMSLWTGNTPEKIHLYENDGEWLVLPYGCLRDIWSMLHDIPVESTFTARKWLNYRAVVPLYDYQQKAVSGMLKAKGGILQAPAGSGKTQMGISLIAQLGAKTLWLTHTHDLLRQSYDRAAQYIDESYLGTITEGKVNIGSGITFATVQTMCKLDLQKYRNIWDCVVVDECFPAGTPIETIDGQKPIESIKPGDKVLTRNETSGRLEYHRVNQLQIRPLHRRLVRIKLEDGTEITCTSNHPIYTLTGYKKAGDITDDDLCYVWKGVRREHSEQNTALCDKTRRAKTSLLEGMLDKSESDKFSLDGRASAKIERTDDCYESQKRIKTHDGTQPNAPRRDTGKGFREAQRNGSQTSDSGWKRERDAGASEDTCRCSEQVFARNGIRSSDEGKKSRISSLLQNRHCDSVEDDCNRGGWPLASVPESSGSRSEKDGVSEWVRVESIEVQKPRDLDELERLCPGNRVYNLSVMFNHNYFANGILVHNCHRVAGSPTTVTQFSTVLGNLAARFKYGLSATVHRADGMIQATYALLGKVMYTVPASEVDDRIMKVGIQPVRTGVGISRECLNADGTLQYARLVNYLCGNAVRNKVILHHLRNNKRYSSLILSDRLDHLRGLINALPAEMRNDAVMIDGKMTSKKAKAERDQAIEDMRQGRKKYLFATYSLAREGLDIPRLERLYLTTPQKDYAVITQSIGRIARTFEGKAEPVTLDFVDDAGYLVRAYKKRCTTYRKNNCYFLEDL